MAESKVLATKLNTSYTDPTALHTGFRRSEHASHTAQFASNEDALRQAQGLPPISLTADPSKDATLHDMPQDLIDFMNVIPELQKVPSTRPMPPISAAADNADRPLPRDPTAAVSSSLASSPATFTAPIGTMTPDVLKSILCEYHWGTPDQWGEVKDGAIPRHSKGGSVAIVPKEIIIRQIAERVQLTAEDIKVLVTQLNIPEAMKGKDGEVLGAWRERGGGAAALRGGLAD